MPRLTHSTVGLRSPRAIASVRICLDGVTPWKIAASLGAFWAFSGAVETMPEGLPILTNQKVCFHEVFGDPHRLAKGRVVLGSPCFLIMPRTTKISPMLSRLSKHVVNTVTVFCFLGTLFLSCDKESPVHADGLNRKAQSVSKRSTYPSKGIRHLFTIGDDSSNVLVNVTSFFVRGSNRVRIYALDRGAYQIKLFDESGRLVKAVGAKGSGPGEFKSPMFLGYFKEHLVVSEQFSPRGHLFDTKLNYKQDILLEVTPNDMATLDDSLLILNGCSLMPLKPQLGVLGLYPVRFHRWNLPVVELPSNLRTSNRDDHHDNYDLLWYFSNVAASMGKVWIAYLFQNKIFCMNNKEVLWRKSIDTLPEYSEIEKDFKRAAVPAGKLFKDIAVDHNGFAYVLVGDYGEYPNREIMVLGPNGNDVEKLILPQKAFALELNAPDKLYTIGADKTRIYCYQITSEKLLNRTEAHTRISLY